MLVAGKRVVVSGAGPGLGRSLVKVFCEEGANVVATDRDQAVLDRCAAEFGVAVMRCDITDGEQCAAAVAYAASELGGIDVLVNDAYSGGDYATFEAADLDQWQATAAVNYIGTLRMCQAVVPHMKAQGNGRIININTEGVEWIQTPFGAYSASKAALQNATRVMAYELGSYGIRVNGIHPGPMLTNGLRGHLAALANQRGVSVDEVTAEWAAQFALRFIPEPSHVADAVVLLASERAGAISGQSIFVNGGHWFN